MHALDSGTHFFIDFHFKRAVVVGDISHRTYFGRIGDTVFFGSCSGKSEFGAVGIGDSGASPYIGSSPLKIESGIVRGVDRNIFCLTSCKYQRQKKEIEYFFRFHNMLF